MEMMSSMEGSIDQPAVAFECFAMTSSLKQTKQSDEEQTLWGGTAIARYLARENPDTWLFGDGSKHQVTMLQSLNRKMHNHTHICTQHKISSFLFTTSSNIIRFVRMIITINYDSMISTTATPNNTQSH